MKMTIAQEPLVGIDPTSCKKVSSMKSFWFFLQFGIQRWPPFAVTNNSAEHENDNILLNAKEFDQICVKIILAMSCFKIKWE